MGVGNCVGWKPQGQLLSLSSGCGLRFSEGGQRAVEPANKAGNKRIIAAGGRVKHGLEIGKKNIYTDFCKVMNCKGFPDVHIV